MPEAIRAIMMFPSLSNQRMAFIHMNIQILEFLYKSLILNCSTVLNWIILIHFHVTSFAQKLIVFDRYNLLEFN